ncbi:MAG: ligase-associated DNA damage response endonuclease PdeM [Saprospiraceae bacterium]|jgi:DNA ligase-associated metallophosphoesterase
MQETFKQCQELVIKGQHFLLHPQKALFWVEQKALVLADAHFGKGRHFRKNGIPVPQMQADVDYDRFIGLLLEFKPAQVIFLGDLFHSSYNEEWMAFSDIIQKFQATQFILVKGNHDILNPTIYEEGGIIMKEEPWRLGPFALRHHPAEKNETEYSIGGHLHPGVLLKGASHQRLRLPCFYFGKTQAVLPAFGSFTGLHLVQPETESRVFVIGDGQVFEKS